MINYKKGKIMKYILIVLFAINLITLLLYGADKVKAKKKKWRIPEAVLLTAAFLGGSFGALLGMNLFHHKTNHAKFKILVPLFLVIHVGLFVVWCVYR